jgi:hypothetical protein
MRKQARFGRAANLIVLFVVPFSCAQSPVCLAAVADGIHRHGLSGIIDLIKHAIVTDPQPVSLAALELLHSGRSRIQLKLQ